MNSGKQKKGGLRWVKILFTLSLRNVQRHWLRSLLAAIGIIIGVIAVTSLGILGNGISLLFTGLVSDVGDTIIVTPHVAAASGDPFDPRSMLSTTISDRDIAEIEKVSGQNRVIPMIQGSARIVSGDSSGYVLMYVLRSEDMPIMIELEDGSYPRPTASGVVMGALLAEEYKLSAGNRVEVNDERVRVVGVAKERGMGLDINPDYGIVVTYEWYEQRYGEQEFSRVVIKVEELDDIPEVKAAIDDQLNRRTEKVDIVDSRELLELFYDTVTAINVFLVGIGGVSLFVSGISILTVMIISVTERTREIGILRSLGTRRGEIMLLFLFEALVLGIVGSLIGGVVSTLVGYAIHLSLNELLFGGMVAGVQAPGFGAATIAFIVFGMIFGTATSVLAGAYPAWKASLLKPIEALHYE